MKKAVVVLLLVCGCTEQSTEHMTVGNVAEISTISISVDSRNWDADAEDDGIVVGVMFQDKDNQFVLFEGHEFLVTIEIYITLYDQNAQPQKGRLVYKNTFRMRDSREIDSVFGRGLEIPFTEFTIQPGDGQYGTMDVTVKIPGVGTYYGEKGSVPLYP